MRTIKPQNPDMASREKSEHDESSAVMVEPIFAEHVDGAAVTLRLVGVQRTTITIKGPASSENE